jgi:hypothetical protein
MESQRSDRFTRMDEGRRDVGLHVPKLFETLIDTSVLLAKFLARFDPHDLAPSERVHNGDFGVVVQQRELRFEASTHAARAKQS